MCPKKIIMIPVIHSIQPCYSQVVNDVLINNVAHQHSDSFLCMYSHVIKAGQFFCHYFRPVVKNLICSLLLHHYFTLLYTSQNVLQGIVYIQCSLGHNNFKRVDQILEQNHLQLFANLILIPGLGNKYEFSFCN